MSTSYKLWRGGQSIEIEKEANYFTTIVPNEKVVKEIANLSAVQEVDQVFQNVFKVFTREEDLDNVMDHIRNDMNNLGISHHAYTPVGDSTTRYYITDQLIVQYKAGVEAAVIEQIMADHGLEWVKSYREGLYLMRVTKSAGKNPVKVCNDLHELPEVDWVEPNLVNRFMNAYTPTDDLFSRQWHLKSWDGIELIKDADARVAEAWDTTRGSSDVIVAVIDDGFDIDHPDLKDKIVFPRDFVDGDSFPFPSNDQGDYHGTPCAGVAVGAENGVGIVGVAPGCSFMPVRFSLAADDNLLWEIFDFVGQKADVLSCSWGPVPVYAPLSSLLSEKFTQIATTGGPKGKGAVICFAAGNFNAPINDPNNTAFEWRHPNYGILTSRRAILNGNVAHPEVIGVSASSSQNRKSAYSNWGKEISVCAPSDNWHPIDPQQRMPGRGIWTTDNEDVGLGFTANSRYTGSFGGTSSATPLVAGVAALVRSANPELTAREIKAIIEETADKIEDLQPDVILGNTKGTYANGHSEWFGYGKVNAAKAVARALELAGQGDTNEDPVEPPVEVQDEGLYIVAALVNPTGYDTGKETVSILNARSEAVQLRSWMLRDNLSRTQILGDLLVEPGAFATILLSDIRLPNRGGSVQLESPTGRVVSAVSYTAEETGRSGWTLKF
ncbi:MAG: S8 family serine peptidase [Phaeodactylibacter sp.]|nr:S8 family serine peptidase [Phaeodactylibacter sp.]